MTTKTDIDLLRCPFCGGQAEMDTRQGYLALGTGRLGNRIAVYCRQCDADMGVCIEDVPYITPEQVAEMWNRRAAVEADRQGRMPSDAEIDQIAYEHCDDTDASGEEPRFNRQETILAFARALLSRYSSGQPAASAKPPELHGIANALAKGNGFWRSCSGCHELNEGHDTGPYSETLKCHLGNGCSECGGIGAIWDMTDYGAMGDEMARKMVTPVAQEPVAVVAWRTVNSDGRPMTDWIDGAPAHGERPAWRGSRFELAYSAPVAAQAQRCNHVYEARPIDGTTRASAQCEPVCRKCGYRPAVQAAKGEA